MSVLQCGGTIIKTFLLLLIVASTSIVVASESSAITLQIAPASNPTKVGRNIRIVITVTNTSQQSIMIADGTAESIYSVQVHDAVGNVIPEKQYPRARTLRALKLEPGESHKDEIAIGHMFDLSRPGKYVVDVKRVSRYEPEAGTESAKSKSFVLDVSQ